MKKTITLVAAFSSIFILALLFFKPATVPKRPTTLFPTIAADAQRFYEKAEIFYSQYTFLPAKIIARSRTTWSSGFWIDKGSNAHPAMRRGSAVVYGEQLIGYIQNIEQDRAHVRLLSDPHCILPCDIYSQSAGSALSNCMLDAFLKFVHSHPEKTEDEKRQLLQQLTTWRVKNSKPIVIARGEIFGYGATLWSAQHSISGRYFFSLNRENNTSIRTGDLVVTNGIDALIPPGFIVGHIDAVVTTPYQGQEVKITPLYPTDHLLYVAVCLAHPSTAPVQ